MEEYEEKTAAEAMLKINAHRSWRTRIGTQIQELLQVQTTRPTPRNVELILHNLTRLRVQCDHIVGGYDYLTMLPASTEADITTWRANALTVESDYTDLYTHIDRVLGDSQLAAPVHAAPPPHDGGGQQKDAKPVQALKPPTLSRQLTLGELGGEVSGLL